MSRSMIPLLLINISGEDAFADGSSSVTVAL